MKLSDKLARNIDNKQAKFLSSSAERCSALGSEILEKLSPLQQSRQIAKEEGLPHERAGTPLFYRVVSGLISLRANNRITFLFEPGDAVGMGNYHERDEIELVAEEDSEVEVFRVGDALDAMDADASLRRIWTEYCAHQIFILQCVIADNIVSERMRLKPRTVTFKAGKQIIKEDSRTSDVYVLLEGRAVATKAGRPVGTIREDEIFGAIAAILDEPRTASVTAINECTCLRYSRDEFFQLINDCPGIVLRMVDGMAKAIASATQKLVR
ncbi:MAG: cyclic nucleotide-binding domain-containing protein [Bdellovibrionales bacterium]|nr:cyclic nucleotide-binding domain-containing protein [Bdellovibrionales bacterium]